MDKKNTMLTLSEKVVENAKLLGMNLSEIAERAIKKEVEERIAGVLGDEIVRVPETEKLTVQNVGPFRGKLEIDFSPGVNVIVGLNASGKTTILNCLRAAYTSQSSYRITKTQDAPESEDSFIKTIPKNGEVEKNIERSTQSRNMQNFLGDFEIPVGALSGGEKSMIEIAYQVAATHPSECYLKDDPLMQLTPEARNRIFELLQKQKNQSIITDKSTQPYPEAVNVIELERDENGTGQIRRE